MSPITFKQQVDQLVSELARCIELCEDIRAHRNIGSRHENLDRFQSTLESAEGSIPMAYSTTRRLVGSQLEIGDEKARSEMDRCIVDLQTRIKPRLREIAQPSRHHHHHRHEQQQQPGFRDLLNQWKTIYQDVCLTMRSLSRRLETTTSSQTSQTSQGPSSSSPSPPPSSSPIITTATPKSDTITIPRREYDRLVQHLKDSWEEVLVDGRSRYVNVQQPNVTRGDMPVDGYVKLLLQQPRPAPAPRPGPGARSMSYERRSPRSRSSLYE